MSTNRSCQRALRGVIAIEFAVASPIFFAFVFGLIWFGTYYNFLVSVPIAIDNGLRAAATRGQSALMEGGDPYSQAIQDWSQSGVPSNAALAEALSNHPEATAISDYLSWQAHLGTPLPTYYILAQVFINETVRESLGGAVIFPCNPDTDTKTSEMASSCMQCIFLKPSTLMVGSGSIDTSYTSVEKYFRIAIRCRIRPGNQVFRLFFKIMSAMGLGSGATYVFPTMQYQSVWTLPYEGTDWYR